MYAQSNNLTPEQMKQLNELLSQSAISSRGGVGFLNEQPNAVLSMLMNPPQQPQQAQPSEMGSSDAPIPLSQLVNLRDDNSEPGVTFPSAPRNYIQNNQTGRVTSLDNATAPAGPALDYTQPIEYGGMGKGFMVKGDPFTAVIGNNIVRLGQDTAATRQRQKEDLANQKTQAEIARIQAETRSKGDAGDNSYVKEFNKRMAERMFVSTLPDAERARYEAQQRGIKLGEGQTYDWKNDKITNIPGGKADLAFKKQKSEHETQLDTTNQWIDAAIADIDALIGEDPSKLKLHRGFEGSVGPWDAKLPSASKDQATAKAFIEGLLAKTSVQGLQGIRQAGTAPGSITEREWPIFQNLVTTLNPNMKEEDFAAALHGFRSQLQENKAKILNRYNSMYGDGGDTAPTPPPAEAKGAKKSYSGAEIEAVARRTGKTVDQVKADMRAKGLL